VHQHAKFRVDCLDLCRDMALFRLFKMAATQSTILDFENLEILPTGPTEKANMHLHAKFCDDRSNFCGDMANFRFFKIEVVRHLGFVLCVFGPSRKSICWSLSLQNLVGIGAVVSIICKF